MGGSREKENKQRILVVLLLNSIRLLHPMTPFITEELFSHILQAIPPSGAEIEEPYWKDVQTSLLAKACISAPYPKVIREEAIDPAVEETFLSVYELVRTVRNIRAEMQLPPSEKSEVFLSGAPSEWSLAKEHQNILLALTPTTKLHFSEKEPSFFGASALWKSLKLTIPMPDSLKMREKERLQKEKEKLEKLKDTTEAKLANPEFKTKAPREVVEKLESALLQTKHQLEEISLKIAAF